MLAHNHDVGSLVFNPFKTMFYEDPSVNKVKTPQTIEVLQSKLMVMLGHYCPEVGFASDQEIVQTLKAPHH